MSLSHWYLSGLLCLSALSGTVLSKPEHVIPLSINSDLRYEARVDMSSTAPQTLSFALTTSVGYLVVAGANCSTCGGVKTYNQSESQSAQDIPGSADISLGTGSANGTRIKEDCKFYTESDKGWEYKNQTIIVANASESIFSDTTSGILGMGRNREASDFSSTLYSNWLNANSTRLNLTFGMLLNPPYGSPSDGGAIHWLGVDNSAYSGDLTELSTVDTNLSDWAVTGSGWSFQTSSTSGTTTRGDLLIVLDPYESDIFIPSAISKFIYSAIPGSQTETPSSEAEVWTVPCDSKFSFSLLVGQKEFMMTEKQLIHKEGSKCYSALRGWVDGQKTHLLLGSLFISGAYIVFTVNKSGAGTIGFGLRDQGSQGIPTSTVIAIVIGVAAFILSAAIIAVWFLRRRMRKQKQEVQQTLPDPYRDVVSAESRALLGQPSPATSPYTPGFDHASLSQRTSMLTVVPATPGFATYADSAHIQPTIREDDPPPEYETGQQPNEGPSATTVGPRREKPSRS